MKEKKEQSPVRILMEWGNGYRMQLILSILLAVIGVSGGIFPYGSF